MNSSLSRCACRHWRYEQGYYRGLTGPHGARGIAIWFKGLFLRVALCCVMAPRVLFPRFMESRAAPRALFLLDSFAYVCAPWGRECYVQQVLEHLFFAGTIAIAVVLGGACVVRGDYERMYDAAARRFCMGSLSTVVVISMGNDLIASSRPMSLRLDAAPHVVRGLRALRRCLPEVETALVYGAAGVTWGYPASIVQDYDRCVGVVLDGMAPWFDYVTSGASELLGVTPIDAIGHLHVSDALASGRLLLSCMRRPRSRL